MNRHEVFERIVAAEYVPLLSYARFLMHGAQAAEDVAHQAFMLAFERLAGGRPLEGDAGKWLRGTVRNLAREAWRQKRRMPEDLADTLDRIMSRLEDPGEVAEAANLRAALRLCLQSLPSADREMLRQRYENGCDTVKLAANLGMNPATARVRLFRVRQALRSCVEARLAGEGSQ